jgi:hypothetical protein
MAPFVRNARSEPPNRPENRPIVVRTLHHDRAGTGLVVAVDNVQWLDTPTGHVLAFALRRLADVPCGCCGTPRPPCR